MISVIIPTLNLNEERWLPSLLEAIRSQGVDHEVIVVDGGSQDLTRRLERFGRTCCINNPALITSSRRFSGRRPREVSFGWIKLHVLFWLGACPGQLAEIYNMHASRPKCGEPSLTPPRLPASIVIGERFPFTSDRERDAGAGQQCPR